MVDMLGSIRVADAEARSRDVPSRMHENLLRLFASAVVTKAGEFHTPRCGAWQLVAMRAPYGGWIDAITAAARRTCSSSQHLRPGRRAAVPRRTVALWSPSEGQRNPCVCGAHGWLSCAERRGEVRAGQRVENVQTFRRGRRSRDLGRGGYGELHGGAAGPVLPPHSDPRLRVVPCLWTPAACRDPVH